MRVPSLFRNLFAFRQEKRLAQKVTPYPYILQFAGKRPVGPRPMPTREATATVPASAPAPLAGLRLPVGPRPMPAFVPTKAPRISVTEPVLARALPARVRFASQPGSTVRRPMAAPVVEGLVAGLPVGEDFHLAMALQASFDTAAKDARPRVRVVLPLPPPAAFSVLSSRPVGLQPSLGPAARSLFPQLAQPVARYAYPAGYASIPMLEAMAKATSPSLQSE